MPPDPEVWSPAQLAEAGVDVSLYLEDGEARVSVEDEDDARTAVRRARDESVSAWVARAYAEATRIAKERQKPTVYHFGCPSSGISYILTPDNRVVGETPEVRRRALCMAAANQTLAGDELLVLQDWAAEVRNANAAIAVARSDHDRA